LVPGINGLSDNIRIISIVGRFLEHSRIYIFANGGDEKVYLSSADWMTRNLNRRIEIMFPVECKNIKNRILAIMQLYFRDNVKAWRLTTHGAYEKVCDGRFEIHAHEILRHLEYKDNNEFVRALAKYLV